MAARQLKVTQTGSPVGRPPDQRATLVGLGLNKISRSKIWPDEPAVRGRINKVRHLVRVEEVEGGTKPAAKRKTKSKS